MNPFTHMSKTTANIFNQYRNADRLSDVFCDFKYERSLFLLLKLCGCVFCAVFWFTVLCWRPLAWDYQLLELAVLTSGNYGQSSPPHVSDPNASSVPEPAAARCGLGAPGARITVAMVTATANCLDNIGPLMRSKRAGLRLRAGTGGGERERNQPVDVYKCWEEGVNNCAWVYKQSDALILKDSVCFRLFPL